MGGLFSGITDLIDGGASKDAIGASKEALAAAQNIPLPVLREYYPDLYKQVVQLNPELETAVNLGPSSMEGVSTDPAYKAAQMAALQKMQDIGNAGGKDAQFISDANHLQTDINSNLQGQEGAIQQNLATRGMSGGGNELVARQMAAQGASNRQAQMSMDLNAQAQQRALQAMMNSGQMAGQMQSQDFNQQSSVAQAKDAINKFNTMNQQQVIGANVASKNDAQKYNASNTQNIANQNTDLTNQSQLHNDNLAQQDYDNKLKKLGIVTQGYNNIAGAYNNQSNSDKQFAGNLIGAGASAYAGGKK